jgi:hypothetical protein
MNDSCPVSLRPLFENNKQGNVNGFYIFLPKMVQINLLAAICLPIFAPAF